MTIFNWFNRYIKYPLFILLFFTILISTTLISYEYFTEKEYKKTTENYFKTFISDALVRKNRILTENIVNYYFQLNNLKFLYLCENDKIILSRGLLEDQNCNSKLSTVILLNNKYRVLYKKNPSIIHFKYPILILFLFFISLTMIHIFYNIIKHIKKDILSYFSNKLIQSQQSIVELDDYINLKNDKDIYEKERLLNESLMIKSNQLAHDIRSPLTALQSLKFGLKNTLSDIQYSLLENTSTRIEEIVSDLTYTNSSASPIIPRVEVDVIVSEIRQRQNFKKIIFTVIQDEKKLLYIDFPKSSFRRILANLVNNSVDAIHSEGQINIIISSTINDIIIRVLDNGIGIPNSIKKSLFLNGFTHNKKNGSGIGLFYVFTELQKYNSSIKLVENKKFTEFELIFTLSNNEIYFRNIYDLTKKNNLVLIDDNPSVFNAWQLINSNTQYYSSYNEAIHAYEEGDLEGKFLIIDYDLGEYRNGFDLINNFDLNTRLNTIISTSFSSNDSIISRAKKLGIKIFPKHYLQYL